MPGQRREVVPVVHWECFKSPVRALGEDIVGRVLCHTSLLYTLEPAKNHGHGHSHSLCPERPTLAHRAPSLSLLQNHLVSPSNQRLGGFGLALELSEP